MSGTDSIVVIGSGAFGTALAAVMAAEGRVATTLVGRDAALIADLSKGSGALAYATDVNAYFVKVGAAGLGRWRDVRADDGFIVRYTYWIQQVLLIGSEAIAVGIYMRWWFPGTPVWMWAAPVARLKANRPGLLLRSTQPSRSGRLRSRSV